MVLESIDSWSLPSFVLYSDITFMCDLIVSFVTCWVIQHDILPFSDLFVLKLAF